MSRFISKMFPGLFGSTQAKSKKHPAKTRQQRKDNLRLELLEDRVVPTGALVSSVLGGLANTRIVGTVYEDVDSNGVKGPDENGVSGWTVYLDLDNSGTLNGDAEGTLEPLAITDKDGNYVIDRLMAGSYRVGEVVPPGWSPTSPVSQDVVVTEGNSTRADFFNFSGGDIVGTVFNDLDQDGSQAFDPVTNEYIEPGLAGWTVILDFNKNLAADPGEPTTVTDANGHYAFRSLAPGDYEVTEIIPDGWEISAGVDVRQTAAVVARTQVTHNFANYSLLNGSIEGSIFNDVNINGIHDIDPTTGEFTEPGLAGWTVYLDLNQNGIADASEPTTTSDASGKYSFISLAEGDYEVTEVLPAGWDVSPGYDTTQTVAVTAGEATMGADFANFTVLNGLIRGTVWNDVNRNSVRDVDLTGDFTEPGLRDWKVYLDLNHNSVIDASEPTALTDVNGEYVFADLQVGDYDVRQILPTAWEVSPTFSDSETVTVYSGTESVAPDFAVFYVPTVTPATISGVVWNDLNGNGIRDFNAATGEFIDPGLAGWTVFVDLDSNGVLDATDLGSETSADGSYVISGVLPGTVTVVEVAMPGWRTTSPTTGKRTISLKNGENKTGLDFGNWALQESSIRGVVFADLNKDGSRNIGESGLAGVTVYLDLDNNGVLDVDEPKTATSADQFFTPDVDEAGSYSFTHLASGTYTVRMILPETLSATPVTELEHVVTLTTAEDRSGVNSAAVYRDAEIHGTKFDDVDGDSIRDADEPGVGGVTVYVDLDRDDILDVDEPTTVTADDGSYTFVGLEPGAYVIREVVPEGYEHSYPTTKGGILWPDLVSNPAIGNVTPTSITTSLAEGEVYRQSVSITLPNSGALTDMVDVFLLFDDTGSFTYNSPIVRAAFPDIIAQLQTSLPGIDLGFGVGRFEEYGNFGYEYSTGRPFVLNQPIVAASTPGYMTAIQAALGRTAPGYGGDQPETDIEALYQLVTGLGFDGNDNGSVLDSGAAGLVSTQITPGNSGDVPSFASFTADPSGNVLAASGTIGGGGFRAGALPIILVATDTGFAYQPKGETTVTGVGGLTLPISALTGTSRPTTPFNSGAGIQETITGLNALGALVIGLGTNAQSTLDPRQGLEALSMLTGAINQSTTTIANGTADAIAPGDPLYFQISSGFAGSVSDGVISAIQNAVTNVAVDITVRASDPRVKIINYTGVRTNVGSGETATFDIEFTGDGIPHRFDLQFVRNGTDVVLGSIPIVIGTPIPGDCYEFEDLEEGEIHHDLDFGSHLISTSIVTPTVAVAADSFTYDGLAHTAAATVTGDAGAIVAGTVTFTYNGSATLPVNAGAYVVVASFTSGDPNYSNATGTAILTISTATPTIALEAGSFSFDGTAHAATATVTGIDGAAVAGTVLLTYNGSPTAPVDAGVYDVVATIISADPNYSDTTATAVLTISAAMPTITVVVGTISFDGLTHAATATVTGVDGSAIAGTVSFTYNGLASLPVDAGVYIVTASFDSADSNYSSGSENAVLTVAPAVPTITVTGGNFPYNGLPHEATAIATGVDGAIIAGAFDITYNGSATLPTADGVYDVVATFTSSDPNYSDMTGTATLTIAAAVPTLTVDDGSFTYDGLAHSAAATVTGVDGNPVAGTLTFTYNGSTTLPVNAAVYDVVATFTSSNPNYSDVTGTATLTIAAAVPTLTVDSGSFTYDGLAHSAAATVTGVDGNPVAGTLTFTYNGSTTLPVNAAVYDVVATFTSGDPNYSDAIGTATLTIAAAVPTLTVDGGSFTYDGLAHSAAATVTGVDGNPVAGTLAFTYNGSTTLPVNAAVYDVVATFTSSDPNYSNATGTATLTIGKATPVVNNVSAPIIDEGTSTVVIGGHLGTDAVFPDGDTVNMTVDGVSRSAVIDVNGDFSAEFLTATLPAGTHLISVRYSGGANFEAAEATSTLTVIEATPAALEAVGIDVNAIAGAPLTRSVASFTNTLSDPSSYSATIEWGDGSTSAGVITGDGETLTVVGSHTYADPGTAAIHVTIVDNQGLGLSATTTSTAIVKSLGLPAGKTKEAEFWHKRWGQRLILSFNGGPASTQLATWLATNFSNLYGAGAGHSNLIGKTNTEVAQYFQQLWRRYEDGVATQIMTTALNVYATTASLGGHEAAAYGFDVSETGLGARSFNARRFGDAVGVPNRTTLNVFEMLRGVDEQVDDGLFYGGNRRLLKQAKHLFDELNSI